jgi:uncharacterized protein (UPF0333 family)
VNKLLVVSALVLALGILMMVDFLATTSVTAQAATNTTNAGNMTGSGGNMTMNTTSAGKISGRMR